MSSVLLIYDDGTAVLTVLPVLAQMKIDPVQLILEEFHPEFLSSGMFDLIVFELFGEIGSSIVVLEQLEKWVTTSGLVSLPVIVVTKNSNSHIEQALRIAKVNFFFVKPVAREDLTAAVRQSLLRPRAS